MSGASGSLAAVASADVTDGKEYTLGANWKQSELVVLNLNGQSFAAPTAQYATLAALVVALEQQVEAAAGGDIVSMVTNDVTNTVTVTANAGNDQAAVVAALQASDIVAVDIGGIYADLSLSASENIYAAYTAETGKVLRNDGGTDEVFGIEESWVQRMRISWPVTTLRTTSRPARATISSPVRAAPTSCSVARVTTTSTAATVTTTSSVARARTSCSVAPGATSTRSIWDRSIRSATSGSRRYCRARPDVAGSTTRSSSGSTMRPYRPVWLGAWFARAALSLTAVSDYQYTLVLTGDDGSTTATLGTVDLNWGTAEALFGDLTRRTLT